MLKISQGSIYVSLTNYLKFIKVIFPSDSTTVDQQLVLKRRDLLESGVHNPSGSLVLDLDTLRDFAICALGRMGLMPAT